MALRWQTLGIAREYRLFLDRQVVGILKNNFWNRKAYGELKGFLIRFENEGLEKKRARILDIEGEKVLGTIDLSFFPNSASIQYRGEQYEWRYLDGNRRSRWFIRNEEEKTEYIATGFISSAGTIADTDLHPILILAGLYIQGYFIKRSFLVLLTTFSLGILATFLFR